MLGIRFLLSIRSRSNRVPNMSRRSPTARVDRGQRTPLRTRFSRRGKASSGVAGEVPTAGRARQVQRMIGKVWTERGRPPERYFTKRTAQAWLRDVLAQAERGTLPGMVRTGRTFANAADEYLRYLADDRQRKPSTVRDARSVLRNHLLPPFGLRRLEDITEQEVDRWARRLGADRPLSNATKRKVIVIFHGVMARACRVYGLPVNPVAKIEKPRLAAPGRHRRVQPGGSACARACGRVRAGGRDLPHGGVHRPAPGRTRRAALARRRLRRLVHPRHRELHQR